MLWSECLLISGLDKQNRMFEAERAAEKTEGMKFIYRARKIVDTEKREFICLLRPTNG